MAANRQDARARPRRGRGRSLGEAAVLPLLFALAPLGALADEPVAIVATSSGATAGALAATSSSGMAPTTPATASTHGAFGSIAGALPPGDPHPSAELAEKPEDEKRPFHFAAEAQFRMLAVTDKDPANDRAVLWLAEVMAEAFEGGSGFLRLGVYQRFISQIDNPALQFQDLQLGFRYRHKLSAEMLGLPNRELALAYYGSVYVPTSLVSARQGLILAPELRARAELEVADDLELNLDVLGQYRFHEYAERAGPDGGMNTQLAFSGALGLSYEAFQHEELGAIVVGGDLRSSMIKRYASRESYESEASSQSFVGQSFGWDAFVAYAPVEALSFTISVEQNGPVMRGGIVNTFFTKLEETELVFTLDAQY